MAATMLASDTRLRTMRQRITESSTPIAAVTLAVVSIVVSVGVTAVMSAMTVTVSPTQWYDHTPRKRDQHHHCDNEISQHDQPPLDDKAEAKPHRLNET